MNVLDDSALRPCTSCQMCAAVCPHDAISISLDDDGFYRPVVDATRCVDCSLCTKVCYRFDSSVRRTSTDELEHIPLYAATVADEGLLDAVTSGGVADLLARELVRLGYVCIGVRYDDTADRAVHCLARTEAETAAFRGSKYIQAYSLPAFREFVATSRHERFAIFGTPCQIYAVSRFLEMRHLRDRCLLVDLYCHGCPSLHAWTKYCHEVKALIRKPRFDRVDFRSKVKGWGNFYVVVVVEGVRAFVSSPRKDEFYTLFFSDQVLNEACADCIPRSTLAYTDIRLGDFWGKRYARDLRGVSAVTAATSRGAELLDAVRSSLSRCERRPWKDFLPYQSYGRDYRPDFTLRRTMLDQLRAADVPLSVPVRTYCRHLSLTGRLKRFVKRLCYYVPPRLVALLKSRLG